jgi:hypothetical protein
MGGRNGGENGRAGDGSKAFDAAGIFRPVNFQDSIGSAGRVSNFVYSVNSLGNVFAFRPEGTTGN